MVFVGTSFHSLPRGNSWYIFLMRIEMRSFEMHIFGMRTASDMPTFEIRIFEMRAFDYLCILFNFMNSLRVFAEAL